MLSEQAQGAQKNMKYFSQNQEQGLLKIISFGGTETVTKNMTVYEYKDEIVIVDCGVEFPDDEALGVDVLIPDFTYVLENKEKVKALVITHAHEDHIGAIPYLIEELNVPIYCNKLVQGFIGSRFEDRRFKKLKEGLRFNLLEPGVEVTIGSFKFKPFRLNHSVPRSMGFAIHTPEGLIMHMADYRVDWTPVLDTPLDVGEISTISKEGVLCFLSDCLGSEVEGYSKSESTLTDTFTELFEKAEGRQLLITTISSNLSRMFQIMTAAVHSGRRVVLGGRSIIQSVAVGKSLGLIPFPDDLFVGEQDAASYPQSDLVYIAAGCYGQQGSALDRAARKEHKNIILEDNSMVVFSADPNPPGVDVAVERLMAVLTLAGAEVIYSKIQANLHVSGHGARGDLTMMAKLVNPKYFIPIGGTITKMREYSNMIGDLGFDKKSVFELKEGETLEFMGGNARMGEKIVVKPVYIDQNSIDEVNPVVVKDRSHLSEEGVFVVVIPISPDGNVKANKCEVVTRGFVYVKDSQELLEKSRRFIEKSVNKNLEKNKDFGSIRKRVESEIERFLYKETGRNPLVIVHTLTV